MDISLFQRLTAAELDQYLNEIDLALEYHNRWLMAVNRAFICREQEDLEHFAQDLLHHCYFGRWYASVDEPNILSDSVFAKIGVLHEELHQMVRTFVGRLSNGENLATDDYDQFGSVATKFRDLINELKNAIKHDLKLIATLMGKVFENSTEGVIIADTDGNILNVNKAFCNVTGYNKEEVIGQNPRLLHSGEQDLQFYEDLWAELLEKKYWEGEIWNKRKNGDLYPEWLMITAVLDDKGETSHYIGIFSDLTSQKDIEERLFYLAHYDSLSKLPNRLAFHDRLKQAIFQAKRNGKMVAVMFLDLDGFKEVNDSLGHNAGDEVIRQVAGRLGSVMREADTISRFGGDEFTVLLTDVTSKSDIGIVAQKIIESISEPMVIDSEETSVTGSVGISLYPQHSDDVDTLIRLADMTMYAAKELGKNRYLVYDQH